MPSEVPFPDGTEEQPVYPDGPALLYVPSPGTSVVRADYFRGVAFRVDSSRIAEGGILSEADARRERMLLRALLNHALFLLGPEEGEY